MCWKKWSRRWLSSRRVASNAEVFTCRGTVPKATSNRQPPHRQRRETREDWRGQSAMLVGDSRGKAEPRAPPQQPETETQPAEIFSATQEVPPTSPTPQRKHPSRCQLRKKRRMEQQGTEATQTQPTSEVDSPPANVPALPTTKTLPPRRWERADLRTGTASCSPPGS